MEKQQLPDKIQLNPRVFRFDNLFHVLGITKHKTSMESKAENNTATGYSAFLGN